MRGKIPAVSFLGSGNMGRALIEGALKSKLLPARSITVFDVRPETLAPLKKKGVRIAKSASNAVRGADFAFLCVKPQQMGGLLSEIRPVASRQCFVSIAAGIPSARIESGLGGEPAVVRVMPNTPALIGAGMAAVSAGRFSKPGHLKFIVKFFQSVGQAVVLPESALDAVTAISGSGPAYVFYLAESLLEAARVLGLPEKESGILVRQTFLGASRMLSGGEPPEELRRKVTSPGGTTEAAVRELESSGWKGGFVRAVQAACRRSEELSKSF